MSSTPEQARWFSADAAALQRGDAADDCFGLLLLAYPVSEELRAAWAETRARLQGDRRLRGAYWMPPEHLHMTIATLRRYDAADLNGGGRAVTLNEWRIILDGAKLSSKWPRLPFRLRVTGASFRGSCATLDISDDDHAIAAMRDALELSIKARGGQAVVGGGDRSQGRPPSVCAAADPPPHIPDICHCTVMRWAAEPPDRDGAKAAFEQIAGAAFAAPAVVDETPPERIHDKSGSYVPERTSPRLSWSVPAVVAVTESSPFMHVEAPHNWWFAE